MRRNQDMWWTNAETLIGVLFAVVGLALVISGFYIYQDIQGFKNNGLSTTGTVISVDVSVEHDTQDNSDTKYYQPTVQFTTQDGKTILYTPQIKTNNEYKVGQQLTILYKADNPNQARIDDAFNSVLLPFGFMGLGGVFALIGFFQLFKAWSERNSHSPASPSPAKKTGQKPADSAAPATAKPAGAPSAPTPASPDDFPQPTTYPTATNRANSVARASKSRKRRKNHPTTSANQPNHQWPTTSTSDTPTQWPEP